MYKRYNGYGNTPNQCLIFLKINRLGYSKIINKNDIHQEQVYYLLII